MWETQVIQNAARVLAAEAGPGAEVILFGSYARGEARSDSDLDFLVVVPAQRDFRGESVRLMRALRPMKLYPDIIVMSRKDFVEWGDAPTTLAFEVQRDGKVLGSATLANSGVSAIGCQPCPSFADSSAS